MDPYSYPLTLRLVRPAMAVGGCIVAAAFTGLASHGSRLGLAIPLALVGFVVTTAFPFLIRVGDISGEEAGDRWGSLMALSSVLMYMSAMLALPAWYDHVTARPVAAVVTADGSAASGGPGSQRIQVREAETGDDLGKLWFDSNRDLAVGDRVVVHVDRIGWAPTSDGRGDSAIVTTGYLLGVAGLACLVALLTLQVRADRMDYRRRELRRDGLRGP